MWLRGAAGEPGYLTGKDAEAAACDAVAEPVVTGHADMRVVDKIIGLALAAAGITLDGDPAPGADGEDGDPDGTGPDDGDHDGAGDSGDGHQGWGIAGAGRGAPTARAASRARSRARERFTPDAMQALRYAIARLAIDFVSGPAGIAGWLRTTLLAPPYNTPSLPLDIGYSDSIPASIRRAVLLRDRGCAWPRCGRPAAWCDVHHLQHKKDGGKTAVSRLRAAVPVPPRRLHPPPRLAARAPSRRHHHRLRTRRPGAAQPLTADPQRGLSPLRGAAMVPWDYDSSLRISVHMVS